MSEPLVESVELTKHFPLGHGQTVHALDGVTLSIAAREIVGLVGESGSGKSTYGKTLIGLHDKTSGTVTFKGERLPQKYRPQDFQRHATGMQMIFQDPYSSLNPRMTVGEIIGEGLRLHTSKSGSAIREQVGNWLERVGLNADHMNRYPARVLRRTASAHRHRPGADHGTGVRRLRRAHLGTGCVGAGAGGESARRPEAIDGPHHAVHRP